jgi:nucleotide-binding universal stress UspA family protein
MSILHTKMLLATDGSGSAELGATIAIDLDARLDWELRVVYIEPMPGRHSRLRPIVDFLLNVVEGVEDEAKTNLEELVSKNWQAGGEVAQAHAGAGLPAAEWLLVAGVCDIAMAVMFAKLLVSGSWQGSPPKVRRRIGQRRLDRTRFS